MEQPVAVAVDEETTKHENKSDELMKLPVVPPTNNVQPLLAAAPNDAIACPVKPLVANVVASESAEAPAATAGCDAIDQGPQLQKWSVAEVCDFIRNLPGCSDYAEDFENQEIDGQALLLLKPDNLVSVMNIKLGPALKIIARVNVLRGGSQDD